MSNLKYHLNNNGTRVVLYLRLSDEDRDKLTKKELSESIKNQEIMLRKYAEEQGFEVTGIYNDEDYSGADCDRPNFNKMLKECENGHVDVVLVKTQARFARDIELIDKYVHNKFKEWNVRFLTLLEKIDNTRRETKKTSQITGMIDEWYVEDTSINIRETFKVKREHGEFTGSFAPYGYRRDPENKNHLLIDAISAKVVERIYQEYSKGYGINKIAKCLTNDNILSPLEYKKFNNCKLKIPVNKKCIDYQFIKRAGNYIIKNHFYNNTKQALKNLTTVDIITADNKINFDKFTIRVNKISTSKTRLFYSFKDFSQLKIESDKKESFVFQSINFNNDDWYPLLQNDIIPKGITCLASYTPILDRMHEIDYEIEAELKENRNQAEFFYKSFSSADNFDTKLVFDIQIRNKHKWSEQTIKKILRDEVYIGNLLQFKTTYVSYKNHKVVYNPKDKWIRYDNAHEAIIEKSLWSDVQKRLENRKKACQNGKAHLLANKVYCTNCNSVFCKCGKNDEFGNAYLCCRDKNTKWSNCNNKKYIKEIELQNFVIDKFNNLLDRFYKEEIQFELNNNMIENDLFNEKIKALKHEMVVINDDLDSKSSYFQDLYEDRKNGLLNENEYLLLRKKYQEDFEKLRNRALIIDKELFLIHQKQENLKNKFFLFRKYKHIFKLNIEIVNDFIDKINIGCFEEVQKKREIEIIWNFID